jgi:hypothetical protein
MPDGDMHRGLSGLYQKPYRILCEGKFEGNECARIITRALLTDMKKKGADPIVLAKQMGDILAQGIKDSGNNEFVDCADLSRKLDRLAQQTNIPNRTKSLVLDAGKSILHDLRYGQRFDSSKIQELKLSRARGVVFTLLGCACAYLMGQQVLYLYENGIGAINLPYRESAVGLDHSRSVHPLTLVMVSDVVSQLLGKEFQVKNPFLFSTKAEMCKSLANNGRDDLPPLTMSCDSPHRQKPVQCGYCSSCLLRRQSLAASSIKDKTRYVVLHGERQVKEPSKCFLNMQAQVRTLDSLFAVSDEPWKTLTKKFPILDDIVDRTVSSQQG